MSEENLKKLVVIFLDFDGVLVPYRDEFHKKRPAVADPLCVENLNKILFATGAQIVVTSSWRKRADVHALGRCLTSWGVEGLVIGSTPGSSDGHRGGEIYDWIHLREEVVVAAILEDEHDVENYAKYHVKPDSQLGLSAEDALAAISIIKKQEKYMGEETIEWISRSQVTRGK